MFRKVISKICYFILSHNSNIIQFRFPMLSKVLEFYIENKDIICDLSYGTWEDENIFVDLVENGDLIRPVFVNECMDIEGISYTDKDIFYLSGKTFSGETFQIACFSYIWFDKKNNRRLKGEEIPVFQPVTPRLLKTFPCTFRKFSKKIQTEIKLRGLFYD